MSDLMAFLNARLDEDEMAAKACAEVYPSPWEISDRGWVAKVRADEPNFWVVAELEQHPSVDGWLGDRLDHIARHDPNRVLADIAAKRRIVEEYEAVREANADSDIDRCLVSSLSACLRSLATVYADHPDYQPEWKRMA